MSSAPEHFEIDTEQGRRKLLEHSLERLRRLANRILSESFPGLRQQHELDSVMSELWIRLQQAIRTVQPPTTEDFFRLAAYKARHVLLDMIAAEQRWRRCGDANPHGPAGPQLDVTIEASSTTYDPHRLSAWTQFHQQVNHLPEDERQVFEMHYYLDLSQAEIAKLLNLPPRKVSRLWVGALERLRQSCESLVPLLERD